MAYRAMGRRAPIGRRPAGVGLGALLVASQQATFSMRQVGPYSIRFLDEPYSGDTVGAISAATVQAAFVMPPGGSPNDAVPTDPSDPNANVFALDNGGATSAGPFVQKALGGKKALVAIDPPSVGQGGLAKVIVLVTSDPALASRATAAGPTNAVVNLQSDIRWSAGSGDNTALYVGLGAIGAIALAGILFAATRSAS